MDEPDCPEYHGWRNGILAGKQYLIHDRDPLTAEFLNMLADAGVKSVKLPARSPNLNASAERFVSSIKESCLERMILFGEESLRTATHSIVAHYDTERNHQGLANKIICPQAHHFGRDREVKRHERLNAGLLIMGSPLLGIAYDTVFLRRVYATVVIGAALIIATTPLRFAVAGTAWWGHIFEWVTR